MTANENLTAHVHKGNVKGSVWPPEALTPDEVWMLYEACAPKDRKNARSYCGKRNQAMVMVMWAGLARCNEMIQLKGADYNVQTGVLSILHAKGKKYRNVALSGRPAQVLETWMEAREKLGFNGTAPLFFNIRQPIGKKVVARYVRTDLMKRLQRVSGIAKRVHPHGLRHSGAYHMMRSGIDIGVICKALGHTNIATTWTYLNHLCPSDVYDAMQNMDW